MIFLRLACLLAGILVLVAPPALLFPAGAAPDLGRSIFLPAVLLLAASSFFFICMTGHRIKRSPQLGRLCAVLLLAPLLAGLASLWRGAEPATLWMSGALLSFTLIVSLLLAAMLLRGPSAGRLRAREAQLRHRPHARRD